MDSRLLQGHPYYLYCMFFSILCVIGSKSLEYCKRKKKKGKRQFPIEVKYNNFNSVSIYASLFIYLFI